MTALESRTRTYTAPCMCQDLMKNAAFHHAQSIAVKVIALLSIKVACFQMKLSIKKLKRSNFSLKNLTGIQLTKKYLWNHGQKLDIRSLLTYPPTYIRLYPIFTKLPTYPNIGYPLWTAPNLKKFMVGWLKNICFITQLVKICQLRGHL